MANPRRNRADRSSILIKLPILSFQSHQPREDGHTEWTVGEITKGPTPRGWDLYSLSRRGALVSSDTSSRRQGSHCVELVLRLVENSGDVQL